MIAHAQPAEVVSPYSLDGSTVVQVTCDDGLGTAFYVGDGRFVTARHVVTGPGCSIGGDPVTVESEGTDVNHDWAVVRSAAKMQDFKVAYSCSRMRAGGYYLSTGYADGRAWPVSSLLRAAPTVDADDGSREVRGSIIPGMSGGPVSDIQGVVYAINSWYFTIGGHGVPTSGVLELASTGLCRKDAK